MKRFVLAEGAKDRLDEIFESAKVTKTEVAKLMGISINALYHKMRGKQSSFSAREVKTLLDAFPEIPKTVFKPYRYGDHVAEATPVASKGAIEVKTSKTAIEVKRISNGYEAQFTGIDGKLHSAYGKTEMETRKNAEERMKSITRPEEPKAPDDKAGINISGDEAMVLLNQLMLDLRNGAVSENDKPVLKSIYMRIAVQII